MRKYIIIAGIMALAIPGLMAAQTTSTPALPDAGITPDSPFYFLKGWGESVREIFTFNSEAKARLQIEFAKKRAAEVKALIEKKGADAPGVDAAEKNLQKNISKAGDIINNLKSKGQDVSGLANELDNNIQTSKSFISDAFKEKVKNLDEAKKEIQKQINSAIKSGATSTLESLKQKIQDFQSQKINLEQKQSDVEDKVSSEQEHIQKELGLQVAAEKAISRAEDGKTSIINKMQSLNIAIPSDVLAKFNDMLSQAKIAYDAKNYAKARELAQESWQFLSQSSGIKDIFEKAREAVKEQMKNKIEKQDRPEKATSSEPSDSSRGVFQKLKEGIKNLYELKPKKEFKPSNTINPESGSGGGGEAIKKIAPIEPIAPSVAPVKPESSTEQYKY